MTHHKHLSRKNERSFLSLYFLELFLLKCNENAAFFFKVTQNKVKGFFFLKKVHLLFCYIWRLLLFSK